MSLERDRIEAAGLLTAVPDFGALARVQDKVSAFGTLTQAGLPQPPAVVATSRAELEAAGTLPAFVKTPIGTASAGVCRVETRAGLRRLAADCEREGVFGAGGVLVQQPADGPLVMVQSVFAHGELVAFHACQRVREGTGGGASHKLGLDLPEAREHLSRAGRGAAVARRAVGRRDPGPGGRPVHRHQPAAGRAGQRPGLRRRPGSGPGRGRVHGHVGAAAAGTARGADAPAAAGGAGRGAARRTPRYRARAGERADPPRRLPGQPGRTHAGRRRPARRAPRRADRRDHSGAARRVAALHRRQHRRVLPHPGGVARAHGLRRRSGARPGRVGQHPASTRRGQSAAAASRVPAWENACRAWGRAVIRPGSRRRRGRRRSTA